ncbi:MAG: T9SS type B sorting domain-containing protein [Aureispira sp.]|nr:T9SS type B sorting domain-containing protein [Aureispira sp.]
MKQLQTIILLCMLLLGEVEAQLVVNTNVSAQQLVQNYLVGNGVTVSNVTMGTGCNSRQFGTFTNQNSNLPLSSGIVLSTGYADDLNNTAINTDPGFTSYSNNPNCFDGICVPGDPYLDAIMAPQTSFDAAVLEFDFVPESDTVRFRYVFASEEYNEFVCSEFNDAFAFVLSGPGMPARNIALVPGTNRPVTINTVNRGSAGMGGNPNNCSGSSGSLNYSQYFINNNMGSYVQFDGMTTTLEAMAIVVPCQTYHIKLVVGDAVDGSYDSGVFFEASSFSTPKDLTVTVNSPNNSGVIGEGCTSGAFVFSLNKPFPQDYTINYNILGSASNGTDYTNIATSITIPAGATSVSLPIAAFNDNISEGSETIILDIPSGNCARQTVQLVIEDEVLLTAPQVSCQTLTSSTTQFNWNSVSGAVGYEVSTDGGVTWQAPSSGGLSHIITGLTPNTDVKLWVRAIGGYQICGENAVGYSMCNNCMLSTSILAQQTIDCNGNTGMLTTSNNNIGGTLSYLWSTGETTPLIGNVPQGTYSVTLTESTGCIANTSFFLGEPALLQNNMVSVDVSCFGDNNGSAVAQSSGGTGTHQYSWSNPSFANGNKMQQLPANNYRVTITDANGCEIVDSVEITEPDSLVLSSSMTNVNCFGSTDGTATALVTGGTPVYTYQWSDNQQQTDSIAINLEQGTYCVSVTDANMCTATSCVTITEPSELSITINSFLNVTCNGGNDGQAVVVAAGGSPSYSYLWSPSGATTANATGLEAGMHTVVVSDANGCQQVATVQLSQPNVVSASIQQTADISCYGYNDGAVEVLPTGGTGNYTYIWNHNNSTTTNIQQLYAGHYRVTVDDGQSCAIANLQIAEPDSLEANLSFTEVSCHGGTDGTIEVNPLGGTATYQYQWSTGNTSYNSTGLAIGSYQITVTDANACVVTDEITVTQPQPLGLVLTADSVSCKEGNNGQIQTAIQGGRAPFTYQWSNGNTNSTNTGLIANQYTLTVTDANGCKIDEQATVKEPATKIAIQSLTTQATLCNGDANGQAFVAAKGGIPNYNYQWSNGQTGTTAQNLLAGAYIVTATDVKGCIIVDTAIVEQPDKLTVNTQVYSDYNGAHISCNGATDGQVQAIPLGGVGGYSYDWSNGQQASIATGLAQGQYQLTLTDANNCKTTSQISVVEPTVLEVTETHQDISCFDGKNGQIEVHAIGGTTAYQYSLEGGNFVSNPVFGGLKARTYSVWVKDANGCLTAISTTLEQPTILEGSLTARPTDCHNTKHGEAQLELKGGVGPYNYLWSDGQTTALAKKLAIGSYVITATDANGCEWIKTTKITSPPELKLELNPTGVLCAGDANGRILVAATGGILTYQNYEYSKDSINWQTGNIIADLTSGIYTIYTRDARGCITKTSTTVESADPFFLEQFSSDTTITYYEPVELIAQPNDTENITWKWSSEGAGGTELTTSSFTTNVEPVEDTRYRFVATNINGCVIDTTVWVRVEKTRHVNAPKAFSPNGDGVNDYFFLQGDDKVESVERFAVYSRWGELLYEVKDGTVNQTRFGWDGVFRNKKMNSGIYVWTAVVKFKDGYTKKISRDVTLLR